MVGGPIALRREQAGLLGLAGDGAFDKEDVCLLAGLQDAELGVDRCRTGDQPARPGLGPAAEPLDAVPGRPTLVLGKILAERAVGKLIPINGCVAV